MGYFAWKPYVPVAKRRQNAALQAQKLAKKGKPVTPVVIEGRTIAKTFWGKSWCENLERYSDYENRLPRGRTYVRNGSVVDLKAARGEITALVSGSDIYTVKITVAPVSPKVWKELCADCAGSIDSLVELLQGRFSEAVMERVCMPAKGLFPSPKDIKFDCSCPDWASMCKHVAAVLYGVGARLDKSPEQLFTLRGVDHNELVAKAGQGLPLSKKAGSSKRIMPEGDLASVFGLEMAESDEGAADGPAPAKPANLKGRTKSKSARVAVKNKADAPVAKAAAGVKGKTKPSSAKAASTNPAASTGKRGAPKAGTVTRQKAPAKTAPKLKAAGRAAKAPVSAPTSGRSSKTPAKSAVVKGAMAAKASAKGAAASVRRGRK